jgi:hypothetical protein
LRRSGFGSGALLLRAEAGLPVSWLARALGRLRLGFHRRLRRVRRCCWAVTGARFARRVLCGRRVLRFGAVNHRLLTGAAKEGEVDLGELIVGFPLVKLLLYPPPALNRILEIFIDFFRCRLECGMQYTGGRLENEDFGFLPGTVSIGLTSCNDRARDRRMARGNGIGRVRSPERTGGQNGCHRDAPLSILTTDSGTTADTEPFRKSKRLDLLVFKMRKAKCCPSECLIVPFAAMCHTRRRGNFAPRRFERAGPATTPFFPSRPLYPWRDAFSPHGARHRRSQGMESDSIWGGPELSAVRVESA